MIRVSGYLLNNALCTPYMEGEEVQVEGCWYIAATALMGWYSCWYIVATASMGVV